MSTELNRRKFMKKGAGILAAAALGPTAARAAEESAVVVTNAPKKTGITKQAVGGEFGPFGSPGAVASGPNANGGGGQPPNDPGPAAQPPSGQPVQPLSGQGTQAAGGRALAPVVKRDIKKGIMYATVPGSLSVMDKFKMIRDAGFDGVEPMGGMDQNEVLRASAETGLQLPSVCDAAHWALPLSDASPAKRAMGREGLIQALHDCKAYGGSSVLLVPAVVNENVSYADAYERSQAEIRKVIPLAEQLGVKMAIENVWNYFLLSPLEAARYVDEFKSDAVGWHFDVGNIIAWGWPEQWIRVLGKRIQKLHIKEYSRKKRDAEGLWKGFQVDYLQGDNNWPAVMKALDDVGYTGWAIAEPAYHPPSLNDAQFLKNVREKIERILAM